MPHYVLSFAATGPLLKTPPLITLPDSNTQLQPAAADALAQLQAAAASAGFELAVASGFRSVERQRQIWNGKAEGSRPVFDSDGNALVREAHSDWAWVQAILRWSALPGASRHHWGTEVDIYDRSALSDDYQLQLTVAETETSGIFGPFYQWLKQQLQTESFGFFRPYAVDRGGVAPEPWHLSYRPLAQSWEMELTPQILYALVAEQDLLLKDVVLAHLDEIFQRFVKGHL